MSEIPTRGTDGRFHFLYVTYEPETGLWYGGKHSCERWPTRYRGSGDWVRAHPNPDSLVTRAVEFFPTDIAAYAAEAEWITPTSIEADPLCMNLAGGGRNLCRADLLRIVSCPDYRARMSATIKALWRDDAGYRAKVSAGRAAYWSVTGTRERHSDLLKARWSDPVFRARMEGVNKTAANRPEAYANIVAANRQILARPEVRARLSIVGREACMRPEVRARKSAAFRKLCVDDPTFLVRRSEAIRKRYASDPDLIARISEAVKAARAREKQGRLPG